MAIANPFATTVVNIDNGKTVVGVDVGNSELRSHIANVLGQAGFCVATEGDPLFVRAGVRVASIDEAIRLLRYHEKPPKFITRLTRTH